MAEWRSLGLDFITLRVFRAAVEEQSFVNAAEREHIAASAISRRISEMEGRLGVPLLRRHDRGVEPTPAGRVLMRHVASLFDIVDMALNDLEALAAGQTGEVRLRANLSTISSRLPPVLGRLAQEFPEISIRLDQANSSDAIADLQRGTADIGFITGVEIPSDLEAHRFSSDRLQVALPSGHPLAARAAGITVADLKGHKYVGLARELALQDLIARKAIGQGFELELSVCADSFSVLLKFVAAGMGVTIAPAAHIAAMPERQALAVLPLAEDWALRHTYVCVKSTASLGPAARLVLEAIQREAQNNTPIQE